MMQKFLLPCIFFLLFNGTEGTLQKPTGRKPKKEKLLPGIAYNNKKLPDGCQVCRLVTEEIVQLLEKGEKVDKEEEKRRKREKRRTGKMSKSNRLMHSIMQDVCDNMMNYLPQSDLTKFRYAHKTVLQDTAVLKLSLTQPGEANKLENKYKPYNHPETYRLKSECVVLIDKYKDDIINWSENITELGLSLIEFLCEERLAKSEQVSMNCLKKELPKDSMWAKTFDILSEHHVPSRAEL